MSGDRSERDRRRYRRLLGLLPRAYRERNGAEMEDAFVALLTHERARHGLRGSLRCWAGAVLDAVRTAVAARIIRRERTEWGGGEMVTMGLADLRFALRSLARRPVFTATAVITIALGIGANASVFTVVNGFMIRPLPYEDPDELVVVWAENPELGWFETDVNPADAWDWRERSRTLRDLAVFDEDGMNLTGGDVPELVSAVRVTPNALSVLGRAPALGRDFLPDELGEDRDAVAILADGFWARRFGRDPGAVGSTLVLDGRAVTVVGILPRDFRFLDEAVDLFVPLDYDPAGAERGGHYAETVARLADGATVDDARTELAEISRRMEAEHPEAEGWGTSVVPLHEQMTGDVARAASYVLMFAVGLVLLMACVNVANLLLARGGARSREVAVRTALGAGRGRILAQLLTESLVLALAGGAIGLGLAQWGYRAIVAALPSGIPPVFEFAMDGTVLSYVATVTLGSVLLFGLVPAVRVSADAEHLRDGLRAGRPRAASRFGSLLVVSQTALAVVLLVGGGLLMKSIAGMRQQDFGFDPENLLLAYVSPTPSEYRSDEEVEAFWTEVTERTRRMPGVVSVGTTQTPPLGGSNWGSTVRVAGEDAAEDGHSVRLTYASEDLFETLGFTMVRGRTFQASDGLGGAPVAIVNEEFVDRHLRGRDPLEATVLLMGGEAPIVGVVHNVVERGVDRPPEPALYLPIEMATMRTRAILVRTREAPEEALQALRQAVWAVDPGLPLYGTETMEALVERRVGGFAVIGQLMAASPCWR